MLDRPVEMWDIKKMVAALVKSHLVDLPGQPGVALGEAGERAHGGGGTIATNDPWRNVFRPRGLGGGYRAEHPPVGENDLVDRENFGWYDHEDGGVYRCIDCFHEIWTGMCSGCQRIYGGHIEDEEEDLFYDDEVAPIGFYDDDHDDDVDDDDWISHSEDDRFEGFLEDLRHGIWFEGGDTDVGGETDVESADPWRSEWSNADGVEGANWRAELMSDSESTNGWRAELRSVVEDDGGGSSDVEDRFGWRMRVRIVDGSGEEDDDDDQGTDSERVRTWVSRTDPHSSERDDEGTSLDDMSGDDSDDDTEGEEDRGFSAPLSRGTRARRTLVYSEESEDEDPPTPNRRRSIRLAVRGRVAEVDSE